MGMFVHYIALSCASSPCNCLFLNLGIYGPVQATVGVGTVLILVLLRSLYKGGGVLRVCAGFLPPPWISPPPPPPPLPLEAAEPPT